MIMALLTFMAWVFVIVVGLYLGAMLLLFAIPETAKNVPKKKFQVTGLGAFDLIAILACSIVLTALWATR